MRRILFNFIRRRSAKVICRLRKAILRRRMNSRRASEILSFFELGYKRRQIRCAFDHLRVFDFEVAKEALVAWEREKRELKSKEKILALYKGWKCRKVFSYMKGTAAGQEMDKIAKGEMERNSKKAKEFVQRFNHLLSKPTLPTP